jgi:GWxTD domain-containing protein
MHSRTAAHIAQWLLLCLLAGSGAVGCSGLAPSEYGQSGKTLSRQPGGPIFDIEVTPGEADTSLGATVYISLVKSSLTFFRSASGFRAACGVSVRALEFGGERMVTERQWNDTLEARSYEETRMSSSIRLVRHVPLLPAKYIIEVEVEDRQSGKILTQRQSVSIPDINSHVPLLGRLLLHSSADNRRNDPITAFHIPLGEDSLRYTTTAYNLSAWSRIRIAIRLDRFIVDSTAAVPPYSYSSWLQGVEGRRHLPAEVDTVVNRTHELSSMQPRHQFEGILPHLRCGIYRLTLGITQLDSVWHENDSSVYARRYFVVMRRGFPRPTEPAEMIDMVRYLAFVPELRALDSAHTDGGRRSQFEQFWSNFGEDRTSASNLIRLYYSRVEEANLLFSSYKEGWKTDRGMLYVVLGPPEYIERKYQSETWYYSYGGAYQDNIFQFNRVQLVTQDFELDEYVLNRSMQYQVYWDRRINKWREGQIF